MSKQVTIHLSRRITLNRTGHEPVELAVGRNLVDVDVANHPFVKAHTTDAGPDTSGELDDLRARVAELVEHRDHAQEASRAAVLNLRDQLDALTARVESVVKERDAALARVTDLEEQLAQKVADMDALVASMTPPAAPAAETKHAKTKA